MRTVLIKLIQGYQYVISPVVAPSCRFIPSCSSYACQVLEKHGFFKGLYLTIKRIARCHPWGASGYDPAP